MIKSFACKETAKIFNEDFSRKLPAQIQVRALEKLRILSTITEIEDLRFPPSNHFKALGGNRNGQHSIRINDQWRICFKWQGGHVENVEITDYH